jgi:hypothetical protein
MTGHGLVSAGRAELLPSDHQMSGAAELARRRARLGDRQSKTGRLSPALHRRTSGSHRLDRVPVEFRILIFLPLSS